jgi:predicted phosphodiesterase
MRTIIFSDVHGNLPALKKLLDNETADRWVSLGDVVGYGPWSNECVDIVDDICDIKLKGNHEDYFLDPPPLFHILSSMFYERSSYGFKKHSVIDRWLDESVFGKYILRHTFYNIIVYPDSNIVFSDNLIIGHSHHSSLHEQNGKKLYSVGSVGQNRMHINKIDYLVADSGGIEFKSMTYDISEIIQEMQKRHYDKRCIEYYTQKKVING